MPRKQPETPSNKDRRAPIIKELTPAFRMTFLSVLALTVLSLLASLIIIRYFPEPSEETKRVLEACLFTWKMGFGAILGLIGGKAMK